MARVALKPHLDKVFYPAAGSEAVQRAFLETGNPALVSHAVQGVLEQRGALVTEHVSSRVRFHGLPAPQEPGWPRAGYVGIYRPYGEDEVELRLLLRARTPYRLLVATAAVNVALWVVFLLTNPSGSAWVFTGILAGFALLAAGLVHVGTLRSVQREEEALLAAFERAVREEAPDVDVESEPEREDRLAQLALEGEITEKRLAQARKAAPRPEKTRRFSLRPKGRESDPEEAKAEDDAETRRAALLARKAELEARRRQGGNDP